MYWQAHAALTIGRAVGVPTSGDKSAWRYYATRGDTVTSEAQVSLRGVRTLYIVRINPVKLGLAAPGQPVGVSPFTLVAPLGTDIQTGGYVENVSDTSLVFSLGALVSDQGFLTGIVEQAVLPSTIAHPIALRGGFRTGLRIGAH